MLLLLFSMQLKLDNKVQNYLAKKQVDHYYLLK